MLECLQIVVLDQLYLHLIPHHRQLYDWQWTLLICFIRKIKLKKTFFVTKVFELKQKLLFIVVNFAQRYVWPFSFNLKSGNCWCFAFAFLCIFFQLYFLIQKRSQIGISTLRADCWHLECFELVWYERICRLGIEQLASWCTFQWSNVAQRSKNNFWGHFMI